MADQGAQGLLSPFLRNRRMASVRREIRGSVLDYGCGAGHLAAQLEPSGYLGVDIDELSISKARASYPSHAFQLIDAQWQWLGTLGERRFDTIIMLALIEHVPDPGDLLRRVGVLLSPQGRMLLTTPNPAFGWIHSLGAKLGVFSRDADEEHEELIGPARMIELAAAAELRMERCRRFLCGANQLFVLQR